MKCIHGSFDPDQCKVCIKNKKRELDQNRSFKANLVKYEGIRADLKPVK